MNYKKLETLIDSDSLKIGVKVPYGLGMELVRDLRARIDRGNILSVILKFVTIEGLMIFMLASAAL